MNRRVVCVATSRYYQKGMKRLQEALIPQGVNWLMYNSIPLSWPTHIDKPYAFKAFAMKQAENEGADMILWADSCILPLRSMEPLWDKIEREGYWIANQMDPKTREWNNAQWTADSAYPDLFNWKAGLDAGLTEAQNLAQLREVNRGIPHVVATAFGLSMKHEIGRKFLAEYYRLASETRAFCGPWWNSNGEREDYRKNAGAAEPCGPPTTLGHRHDQTAASVIAWRLGMKLCDPPEIFAYGKAGEPTDERTILIADGSYE